MVPGPVGNIANAVLSAIAQRREIPDFEMYTEVLQDSAVPLLESGRCTFASTCALTLSPKMMRHVFEDMDFFKRRILHSPGTTAGFVAWFSATLPATTCTPLQRLGKTSASPCSRSI
jgi:hypothetical protein